MALPQDLILASKSPRRAWLLQSACVPFRVVVAGVDEQRQPGEPPPAYATRLAREKAQAVLRMAGSAVVVAADTVVALGDVVLEKPTDDADARRMLRTLSGASHVVHTAVAVGCRGLLKVQCVDTRVTFRTLTDAEIDRYVATGEPLDKAGAYGIQGDGGALVAQVNGSYTAVVGLPLAETLALVEEVRRASA
jgi:septum formation protein